MSACISVAGVALSFPGPQGALAALDGIDLEVEERQFVAIVGPSGCGKTSLLRLIAGLMRPTAGTISVLGMTPEEARAQRAFSFVFQQPALLPWRTVYRNVALPCEIAGTSARTPQSALELVGLNEYQRLYPHQLSGGMQQRAALARALTLDPRVLLLDEPFGALDEITRESMNVELSRLFETTRVTAVLVTHSVSEAVFLSDVVLVMSRRPGHFLHRVGVTFPRPREAALLGTPAFVALAQEVRTHLR